jgi:hypothetical protein
MADRERNRRNAARLMARWAAEDENEDIVISLDEPAAALCPTCGSDDINRTEPRWYLHSGRSCPDAFHNEADGDGATGLRLLMQPTTLKATEGR